MMNCEFGDPIILLYLAVKLAHSLDALGQPRMSGSRFHRSEAACQASRRHLMNRKEAILSSSTSDVVRGHGEGGSVSRSSRASAPPRRAVTRRRSAAPPLRRTCRASPRARRTPQHSAKGCPGAATRQPEPGLKTGWESGGGNIHLRRLQTSGRSRAGSSSSSPMW